jgi:plasmid stabilization system protein ParE
MHREIIWSPLAEKDFDNILNYLAKNWSQNVLNHFLNKIDIAIKQIARIPNQFPIINKNLQVRKCVVTKQNTLFNRKIEHRIEILRLYDTRQDTKNLKFI